MQKAKQNWISLIFQHASSALVSPCLSCWKIFKSFKGVNVNPLLFYKPPTEKKILRLYHRGIWFLLLLWGISTNTVAFHQETYGCQYSYPQHPFWISREEPISLLSQLGLVFCILWLTALSTFLYFYFLFFHFLFSSVCTTLIYVFVGDREECH